ncbi:hypothetical protein SUGI_0528170 [Cryptomeria japonica]|nr:hypothetical protein SUGI_0528170 [Cryptomeria japonica]
MEFRTDEYYLCIVQSGSIVQAMGQIVWTANYDNPVTQNAALELQMDGNLVLSDSTNGSRRKTVWSTGTGGMGVEGLKVLGGGVLQLLGKKNNTVWQSMDFPTDTLLFGQVLQVGDVLYSRSSDYNLSRGSYVLVVKPGGLGLYVRGVNQSLELYWMWKVFNNNGSTLDDPGHRCSNLSFMVSINWPNSEHLPCLVFQNNSPVCNGSLFSPHYYLPQVHAQSSMSVSDFGFIRLDYDGNLRAYASGRKESLYQAMSKCQLPGSCGSYGVCSEGEACECPNNGTHQIRDKNGDCGLSGIPSCGNRNESWQMFSLAGVEYHRNQYAIPMKMPSKENCSDYCSRNCSCRASFYISPTNSCFVVLSQVGTLSQISNENSFAFIKLQSMDLVVVSKHSDRLSRKTVIWIAVVVSAAVFCVLWFCPWKLFRDSKPEQISSTTEHPNHRVMTSIPNLTAKKFSFKEIQSITRNFRTVLGFGGFGTVYDGVLGDSTQVAVKKLEIARQGEKEFYSEVAILGIIHHWNLVQLLGFCSQDNHKILVYEHMANGSLDQWLFNNIKIKSLTWPIRFNIALGTARGLAYLHEQCRYKIIHLDVKPQNILLDENFVAKVSDFGMATLMGRKDSRVVTSMRGTPGYLAPEWLLQSAITEKSDVYSFGMVVLEIIGGRKNYSMNVTESDKHYFPAWAMSMASCGRELEVIDSRLEDEMHRLHALRVLKIGFLCIQEDAQTRPTMGSVVKMLEGEEEVPEPCLRHSFQFAIASRISPSGSLTATASLATNHVSSPSLRFVLSR